MFICTGNIARSQIAEGLAKNLAQGKWEVYSAGLLPKKAVHPYAILVMKEIGIDISSQKPKAIDEKLLGQMDMVVTLCQESCPAPPAGINTYHWSIPDPAIFFTGIESEIINGFRTIREMIKKEILELLKKEAQF